LGWPPGTGKFLGNVGIGGCAQHAAGYPQSTVAFDNFYASAVIHEHQNLFVPGPSHPCQRSVAGFTGQRQGVSGGNHRKSSLRACRIQWGKLSGYVTGKGSKLVSVKPCGGDNRGAKNREKSGRHLSRFTVLSAKNHGGPPVDI